MAIGFTLFSCSPSSDHEGKETKDTTEKTQKQQVEKIKKIKKEDEALMSKLLALGISPQSNPQGLKAGELAPDVVMNTSEGISVSLREFYQDQPLVIIFYRGYWCPACNKYLSAFSERTQEIEAAGAKVVAITPETYENAQTTAKNTGIDFTVISDADGKIMNAFDVSFDVTEEYQTKIKENFDASIAETNASKEAVLPVPATFIIDTDGQIIYRQFDPNYKNRASVDKILEHLPQ